MALQVKFTLCQTPTCTKLEFREETGLYNLFTNAGGYDQAIPPTSTNPSISQFEEASLEITTPSGAVYNFNIWPTFPSYLDTTLYTINGTDLGYPDNKIADGIYQAVYTIAGAPDLEYTVSKYFLFTCQIECCITKLYSKVTPESLCKNCDSPDYLKAALEAEGYVCAAKNAMSCGKLNLVKTFLAKAESVCANLNCKCC
jgi:hypothetical protein